MIPIILSTACYHNKYEKVIDSVLRAIKPSHGINGIELSFLKKEELMEFEPNKAIMEYSENSQIFIHAPAKNIIYLENDESNKVFTKIKSVYNLLGAKNVTFHLENINSIEYLAQEFSEYNISVENPDIENASKKYFETLENYLENYNIDLTLDIEHARNDLPKFLTKNIKNKISEIHYSNYNLPFNHDSYSAVFERFNNIIAVIKDVNKPVVIEIDLRNEAQLFGEFVDNSRFIISKEIALLKSNLISS